MAETAMLLALSTVLVMSVIKALEFVTLVKWVILMHSVTEVSIVSWFDNILLNVYLMK